MSTASSRSLHDLGDLRDPDLRDLRDLRDPRHELRHERLPALALVAAAPGPLARARARIALAERVGRVFPPRAVVLGFKYFASGGVEVLEASERALRADVKGKRTQHVELHVEGGALAASCTCGATSMGPPACRHVWAALLEVDRRAMFAPLRSTRAPMTLVPLATPPATARGHTSAAEESEQAEATATETRAEPKTKTTKTATKKVATTTATKSAIETRTETETRTKTNTKTTTKTKTAPKKAVATKTTPTKAAPTKTAPTKAAPTKADRPPRPEGRAKRRA